MTAKSTERLAAKLTEGPVAHQLTWLSVPMLWGIAANMAFNAVDTFFVAQLGKDQLAAMTFTFPVILLVTSVAIGIGAGTTSSIARLIGKGDRRGVRRVATDALGLSFIVACLIGALGYFTIDPLFTFMGAKPELLPYLNQYMSIWYLGTSLLLVPLTGLAALRGIGDSRMQGVVMVGSSLLNAILDPILIFGLWGFPRLEMEGAAIASLLARFGSLLITLWVLQVSKGMLAHPIAHWREYWKSSTRILAVGLPATGTNIIIPISHAVIVAMVARYGTDAVAGLGIATRIEPVALVFFYALSAVIGPFVGQNLGAGKQERIEEAMRLSVIFCVFIGCFLAILIAVINEWIVRLFNDAPGVLEVASTYLYIVPLSYGTAGVVMVVNAAFNGLGRPLPAVAISLLRVIVLYLPCAYLFDQWWGLQGIFAASCLINFLVGVGCYYWQLRVVQSLFRHS